MARSHRSNADGMKTPKTEALATLDSLPDSTMALLVWLRDDDGKLIRPCTREEIRAGLLSGDMDPADILSMAGFARDIHESVTHTEALERRQQMRIV